MLIPIDFFKNRFFEDEQGIFILNKSDAYSENFGKQWKEYSDTQIDSKNNFSISKNFLKSLLFGTIDELSGLHVLEIGSGAGRFTEHLVKVSETCISVDMSSAVYYNVAKGAKNLSLVKADFLKLESKRLFDVVICRGVLQHTPDPLLSILKLHTFIKKGGIVYFDIYPMPKMGYLHPKYFFWRPLLQNLVSYEGLESFLKKHIKILLKLKRGLKTVFFNSNFISDSLIPVWDYYGEIDLSLKQLEEWAILDTLDGIYAKHDHPKSFKTVKKLLSTNNIEILNCDEKNNYFKTTNLI